MQQDALSELQAIRSIMERSQRFLAFNSWSATLAGVYALLGVGLGWWQSRRTATVAYDDVLQREVSPAVMQLFGIALLVLILAVGTGVLLSYRMAKRANARLLDGAGRRMALHFSIPLMVGGVFCLICISKGYLSIIAPATLIFYGLGLWSAGNFTFSDVRILGLVEILLGLLAFGFPGSGVWFWALGFGICHIIYGLYHHFKYERR